MVLNLAFRVGGKDQPRSRVQVLPRVPKTGVHGKAAAGDGPQCGKIMIGILPRAILDNKFRQVTKRVADGIPTLIRANGANGDAIQAIKITETCRNGIRIQTGTPAQSWGTLGGI